MILVFTMPLCVYWSCCFNSILKKRCGVWTAWKKKSLETIFLLLIFYFFYETLLMTQRPCNAFPTYNKKERERKKLKSFTLIRSHHQTGQKYDNIWYVILSFLTVLCSFEMEVHRDIEPVWSKILKILLGRLFKPFSSLVLL